MKIVQLFDRAVSRRIDAERQHLTGGVAGVEPLNRDEGSNQQSGTDKQHQAECNLQNNQSRARSITHCSEAAASVEKAFDEVGSKHFHHGSKRKQHSGKQRCAGSENQNGGIDADQSEPPEGLRSKRDESAQTEFAESGSDQRSYNRKDEPLNQTLPDDLPVAGTDR